MKFLFVMIIFCLSSIAFAVDDSEQAVQEGNYNPASCKWSDDIPPKKINVRTLNPCAVASCVGYVVCASADEAKAKFVRLASCSETNCSNAVACVREAEYSSRPYSSERVNISNGAKSRMGAKAE